MSLLRPLVLGLFVLGLLAQLSFAAPAPQGIVVVPDTTQIQASISVAKASFFVGERIEIQYSVSVDAYVYLIDIDATGRVTQIFPNAFSQDNFVSAGSHTLPDKASYSLIVTPPAGTELLQIIAALHPINLGSQDFQQQFPNLGDNPSQFQQQADAAVQGIAAIGEVATSYTSFMVNIPGGSSNQRPTASFSFLPVILVQGQPITFDASSSIDPDGSIVKYEWDFQSDGFIDATGMRIIARLNTAASYPVTLKVTDNAGATGQVTASVQVQAQAVNQPPIARFTFSPFQPQVGESVSYDASASYDPDGSISQYLWDLNGDGQVDLTGRQVTARYNNAGTARITLRVVDNQGTSGSSTQTFQVRSQQLNQLPNARFTFSPSNPLPGQFVTFDASSSSDPDGFIAQYRWDFNGDGLVDANGVHVTRTFQTLGSFNVTLTVIDNAGTSNSSTQTFQVRSQQLNQPPTADFTFSPNATSTQQTVVLDASNSSDSDGYIAQYRWDFNGDGQIDLIGKRVATRFSTTGTFRVELTVVDNQGATGTKDAFIQVSAQQQAPSAAFTYSPTMVPVGQMITFDAASSSDSDGFITQYLWDFQSDGQVDMTGQRATVRFNNAGTFRVTVTVVDNSGLTGSASQFIQVGQSSFGTLAGGFVIDTPETGLIRLRVSGQSNWAGQGHAFRAILETNDMFISITQASESAGGGSPAPQGVAPVPNQPQPTATLEGSVQDNTVTYLIRVSDQATEVKFTLQLDRDANGTLETDKTFVFLGDAGKTPSGNPFLLKFNAGDLLLNDASQVCSFLADRPGLRITTCAPYSTL